MRGKETKRYEVKRNTERSLDSPYRILFVIASFSRETGGRNGRKEGEKEKRRKGIYIYIYIYIYIRIRGIKEEERENK